MNKTSELTQIVIEAKNTIKEVIKEIQNKNKNEPPFMTVKTGGK